MRGRVFDIQHMQVYDGPGIRTVVYLKGCPLRCLWCHNPEGLASNNDLLYSSERCVGCSECKTVCSHGCHSFADGKHEIDRKRCVRCGECARACEHNALKISGYTASVDKVMEEILVDRAFYGTQGGVTLSGGEPLSQVDFALSILSASHDEGINTCVETSGYCGKDDFVKVCEVTDILLFDIKETDRERHIAYTGVDNSVILENLAVASRLGTKIILRCPIVEPYNLRMDHFAAVGALARDNTGVEAIELEPYHPLGLSKYARLGVSPRYDGNSFLAPSLLAPYAHTLASISGKKVFLSTGETI